ncbi:MAG: carboxypeptidase-like regulatory domain-containing protein [Patescibacteria group bacterium]
MIKQIIISIVVVGVLFGGIFLLQKNKNSVQAPAKQESTANWKTYTNDQYGFEIKTPYQLTTLTPKDTGSFLYNGTKYPTVQLTIGEGPIITIMKGWTKTNIDPNPYDKSITPTSNNIAGVTWYGFYDPEDGTPKCATSNFQTSTKDGKDTIAISYRDPLNCWGDLNQEQQILSTFKFTNTVQASTGTLKGHVDIGPVCPVEQIGHPCTPSPETNMARQVGVFTQSGVLVSSQHLDANGNYQFTLAPGTYTIKASGMMVDELSENKGTVTVKSGQTTTLNFNIDTGIR